VGLQIGFVLFPNLTQLDFTGPLQVLSRMPGGTTHILAKTRDPVPSDCNLGLVPTGTFAEAPQLDLICVPGGMTGVVDAMEDAETVGFLAAQAEKARWVTSVCTGAFILGRAGLLQGKRATTHWAFADLLPMVGAVHEPARIVRDGKVITAGGVTSGIDFGLSLLAEVAGPEMAQTVQLGIEYDPDPPFPSGHPSRAPAGVLQAANARYAKAREVYRASLQG
jgi:cyclohexyl-isocyanide hydratase